VIAGRKFGIFGHHEQLHLASTRLRKLTPLYVVGIVLYYNSTTPTVMDSKTALGHGARSRRQALESELAPGAADVHRVPQRFHLKQPQMGLSAS